MLRNEKGSFRGSSDQRGERPGHLHNCRISEHGRPSGGWAARAPHRGLLLASPGGPRGGPERGEAPRGDGEACPGSGDTEAPVPDGGEASGAPKGGDPSAMPGSPGATPPCPAAAAVEVVPVGIGSLLPPGDICAAEPARRLPGRLAGGCRPGGSHRHQRAGIKGLNGTARCAGRGGTWPGPASRSPPHASPAACTPGPAALPPVGPGRGGASGAPAGGFIVPVSSRGCGRRPRGSGARRCCYRGRHARGHPFQPF